MHANILEALHGQDWAGLLDALGTHGLIEPSEGDLGAALVIYHAEMLSELSARIGGTPADGGRIGRAYTVALEALSNYDPARVKDIRAAMGCQYGDE